MNHAASKCELSLWEFRGNFSELSGCPVGSESGLGLVGESRRAASRHHLEIKLESGLGRVGGLHYFGEFGFRF